MAFRPPFRPFVHRRNCSKFQRQGQTLTNAEVVRGSARVHAARGASKVCAFFLLFI